MSRVYAPNLELAHLASIHEVVRGLDDVVINMHWFIAMEQPRNDVKYKYLIVPRTPSPPPRNPKPNIPKAILNATLNIQSIISKGANTIIPSRPDANFQKDRGAGS